MFWLGFNQPKGTVRIGNSCALETDFSVGNIVFMHGIFEGGKNSIDIGVLAKKYLHGLEKEASHFWSWRGVRDFQNLTSDWTGRNYFFLPCCCDE